jgi:hypothetical protein
MQSLISCVQWQWVTNRKTERLPSTDKVLDNECYQILKLSCLEILPRGKPCFALSYEPLHDPAQKHTFLTLWIVLRSSLAKNICSTTFGVHARGLIVFLEETGPDRTKRGNTTQKAYLCNMDTFPVDVHRIITVPTVEFPLVDMTWLISGRGLQLTWLKYPKLFMSTHKVQGLSTEIHTRSLMLFLHFVG